MIIDHIAIWTDRLEELKDFYVKYFEGSASKKYINKEKQFESYFLTFESGARLELMKRPDIPDNLNDTLHRQYKGIIHLAFGVETKEKVDKKAKQFNTEGFKILREPRITGDGYYEFETVDPDGNRIEITTRITHNL